MRRYRCHKTVSAAPYALQGTLQDSVVYVEDPDGDGMICLDVPNGFFARGVPAEGDYVVRYEDGYLSWSPKDVFEAGYLLIEEGGC